MDSVWNLINFGRGWIKFIFVLVKAEIVFGLSLVERGFTNKTRSRSRSWSVKVRVKVIFWSRSRLRLRVCHGQGYGACKVKFVSG